MILVLATACQSVEVPVQDTLPPAEESGNSESQSQADSASSGNGLNDAAFDFTLPSSTGPEYSLASFRGDRNVVLVFYRAFW